MGRGGRTTPNPQQTLGYSLHQGATPTPGLEPPPQVAWKSANGSRSNGGMPNPVDARIDVDISTNKYLQNIHYRNSVEG